MNDKLLHKMFPYIPTSSSGKCPVDNVDCESIGNLLSLPRLSNEAKVCIHGPRASGKTAILFQTAISYATEGCRVTVITPVKFQSLPPSVEGTSLPDPLLMKQIKIMYINKRHDLLKYLAGIHKTAPFPEAILVDNLDYYVNNPKGKDYHLTLASICAHVVDAVSFVQKQRESSSSQTLPCLAMVSMTTYDPSDSPLSFICKSFFPTVLTITDLKSGQNLFQMTHTNDGKDESLVTYELGNKIKVLDVINRSDLTGLSHDSNQPESQMREVKQSEALR